LAPAAETFPDAQAAHVLSPDAAFVPAAHSVHFTLSAIYPSAHLSPHVSDLAAETFPDAQAVHSLALAAAYVPASQSVHAVAPSAADMVPAKQSVHLSAPARDYVPAVHFVQSAALVDFVVATEVPAAHLVHSAAFLSAD